MPVVLDASLLVLPAYELESALRSLVFARELTKAQAVEGLDRIAVVPLIVHPPPEALACSGWPDASGPGSPTTPRTSCSRASSM